MASVALGALGANLGLALGRRRRGQASLVFRSSGAERGCCWRHAVQHQHTHRHNNTQDRDKAQTHEHAQHRCVESLRLSWWGAQ